MSGRIKEEDVAHVRERSPIDEVIADYVQLKSAGGGQKRASVLSMMKNLLLFT